MTVGKREGPGRSALLERPRFDWVKAAMNGRSCGLKMSIARQRAAMRAALHDNVIADDDGQQEHRRDH